MYEEWTESVECTECHKLVPLRDSWFSDGGIYCSEACANKLSDEYSFWLGDGR